MSHTRVILWLLMSLATLRASGETSHYREDAGCLNGSLPSGGMSPGVVIESHAGSCGCMREACPPESEPKLYWESARTRVSAMASGCAVADREENGDIASGCEESPSQQTANARVVVPVPETGFGGKGAWRGGVQAGSGSVCCGQYSEAVGRGYGMVRTGPIDGYGTCSKPQGLNAPGNPGGCAECGINGSPSISLPGPGPSMSLDFIYNSQVEREGAFGKGWTHSFEMRLWKYEELVGTQATPEPEGTATTTPTWELPLPPGTPTPTPSASRTPTPTPSVSPTETPSPTMPPRPTPTPRYHWMWLDNDGQGRQLGFGQWTGQSTWFVPYGEWESIQRDDSTGDHRLTKKTGETYLLSAALRARRVGDRLD